MRRVSLPSASLISPSMKPAQLRLAAPGKRTCREVREIAARHLEDIRAKLSDLKRLERLLTKTVARCSGEMTPSAVRRLFSKSLARRPGALTNQADFRFCVAFRTPANDELSARS